MWSSQVLLIAQVALRPSPLWLTVMLIHPTEEATALGDIKSQAAKRQIPTGKAIWDRYPDILGG